MFKATVVLRGRQRLRSNFYGASEELLYLQDKLDSKKLTATTAS